jgi:antitoxin component of MazEF toxin-antitoxin module
MKIKAKLDKIGNFNAMNVPCSNLEFGQLRDGASVEVDDEVANKMLAMGIVDKVNKKSKKAKKGD